KGEGGAVSVLSKEIGKMNCKKIKDLIITDYIDQELSKSRQEEVITHLKTCSRCRAFEQALRKRVSEPLRKIEPVKPPESIWQRVQEAIDEEETVQHSPSLLGRIYDFLKGAVLWPKPVFAFSSTFAVILIAALFLWRPFYRQWTVKNYLLEQSNFIHSIPLSVNGESENGLGFDTEIVNLFF
ncbi:MAG: zf-HC2 domain-containing protein, partial [Candidatus Omnitrophica bacterium]|nr:zf-HC2 domain-containing protein [Candidatus Omnitrophota bacterium]